MEISKIAVVGAGTMGNGIAQVAATAGFPVSLQDIEDRFLERAMATIQRNLGRVAKAGQISDQQADEALSRISVTTDLAKAVGSADLVIEAVPEDLNLKKSVFKKMDDLCPPHTILASNTSQLSITAMASATKRPDKVIGMHWFNPAPVMKLIEVVRTLDTSDDTLNTILDLSHRFGKETVVCRDSEGFIVSRALGALLLECGRIAEEGLASVEDVDKAIKLGLNHPMGPFELSDLVGLDTVAHVAEGMVEAFGDRFRPTQTLVNLARAGHLGRKTGRGYYKY